MSKTRKVLVWIVSVLIIITIAFIWLNSVKTKSESSASSEKVYTTVKEVVDAVFGEDVVPVSHDGIRKFAHSIEFFALVVEFCVLYILIKRESYKSYLVIMPFGLYVAVIDEGIQILSERGPVVRDIFIDYCGYFVALAVFFVVFVIRKAVKKTKNKQNEV